MEITASRSVSLSQSWTTQRDGGILVDTTSSIFLLRHTKVATFVLISRVFDDPGLSALHGHLRIE